VLEHLVHPDDRVAVRNALAGALEGDYFEARCRILLDSGRVKYLRIVGRPIDLPDSTLTFAGAFMDYTETKIAEEHLHHAQSALAHVTRVVTLGELAASIAHEMNQPLAGIVSHGEACLRWLDRDNPDLAEVQSALKNIVADCRRAADFMSRVRGFVRKADTEFIDLDINELISETIPLVQREIAAQRTTLGLLLEGDLPLLPGDKVQLQQVIINLIVNALQAMTGKEGGAISLTISTERIDTGGIRISVADTGSGIQAEHLRNLFDPFFTTKKDGLGMGLSICRSIIESHGGEISATNNGAGGATVSFELPVDNGLRRAG
jgi:C4-dicarboxylate-specific signal transduction histidine kinase